MKQDYLNTLQALLNEYRMDQTEKEDILRDYQDMYESYQAQGMSDDDIEQKLGTPKSIISDLTEGYKKKTEPHDVEGSRGKIVAITPFIALVIFFVLGFMYDLWAYSWMAFLIIPVTAIVVSMGKNKEVLIAVSPFVALIGYGILGFVFNLWHPGWLIFLLIPVTAITVESNTMKPLEYLTAISPFAAVTIFFLYFGANDMWNPGWLIFMMIPMIGVLNEKHVLRIIIWEALFIIGIGGYLYLNTMYSLQISLIAFIPVVIFGLLQGEFNIFEIPKGYRLIILGAVLSYVVLGLLSDIIGVNMWGFAWMVFFAIPVYAISTETGNKERIIAISPFVAVFIFYTLGYFFDLWAISWMAFLIIPVVAILKGN